MAQSALRYVVDYNYGDRWLFHVHNQYCTSILEHTNITNYSQALIIILFLNKALFK